MLEPIRSPLRPYSAGLTATQLADGGCESYYASPGGGEPYGQMKVQQVVPYPMGVDLLDPIPLGVSAVRLGIGRVGFGADPSGKHIPPVKAAKVKQNMDRMNKKLQARSAAIVARLQQQAAGGPPPAMTAGGAPYVVHQYNAGPNLTEADLARQDWTRQAVVPAQPNWFAWAALGLVALVSLRKQG